MIQNNILVNNNSNNSLRFFSSLCETNSILQPSWGVGPATFSRASAQYITDFEGITRKVESGSVAVEGSRVVTNLLTYSEDLSNAAWVLGATATKGSSNLLNLPATLDSVKNVHTAQYVANQVTLFTVTLSGSGTVSIKISREGSGTAEETVKVITLSVIPTRYAVSHTIVANQTGVAGYVFRNTGNTATSVTIHSAQLENVTGQTNTNPGEYVRTTSSALSQCFSTTNGNTVDASGVVTEVIGTSLPQSYPERVNTNTYGLNDRIQVAGWWYQCTTLGISAGSAPTFPQGKAGTQTVTDGSVVWTIGGRLLLGYVSEQASTNKITAYGIIPADTLGSELTLEGAFTTDGGGGKWTSGTGTTIAGGVATLNSTDNTLALYTDGGAGNFYGTAGKIYRITYTITSLTSGGVRIALEGGTPTGTLRTATGTYTEDLQQITNGRLFFSTVGATVASIDNVSVKEVQWATGTQSFHNGSSFVQNITGLTLNGDTAAVLSIVTDQTEIEKAGLAGINPTYKVYKLDNSAGSGAGYVTVSGSYGNTNTHSCSIVGRASGGTDPRLTDSYGSFNLSMTSGSSKRFKKENYTPANSSAALRVYSDAGSTIYFLLPQLEELPYVTSIMPTAGATATRAETSLSYPTAGNLRVSVGTAQIETFLNSGSQVARVLQVDDSGRLIYLNSGAFTAYDGVNSGAIGPTPTANTLYKILVRYSGSSLKGFTNGTAYTGFNFDGSMGSGSTLYVGSSGSSAYFNGYLRNLKIWFKPLSDDRCKQLTL